MQKAHKSPTQKLCVRLNYGAKNASIACHFNQPYMLTESYYYYCSETGIFACFNNLEESEKFILWMVNYVWHTGHFQIEAYERKIQ